MATAKTGITVAAQGEKEFRQAITSINSDMKVLQSELKLSTAQFTDNEKSVEALTSKDKILNEQVDVQKTKIEALKSALANAQKEYGENSTKVNNWKVSLNNAETDLAKLDSELKKNKEALSLSLKEFDNVDKKSSIFSNFASNIKSQSETIKTAVGGVGVAITAFLKSTTTSATGAEASTLQLTNLLKNQGLTANESSEKIDAFKSAITSMSSFSGGEAKEALTTLTKKGMDVGTSLQWSSTLADVAKGSNKSLADSADLVADAYNGKTKALTQLGILTKDEVKQLGDSEDATISYEEVQRRLNAQFGGSAQTELSSYAGQLKENQNAINASKTAIGTALLPMLAQLAKAISNIVIPLSKFVQEHPKATAAILAITAVLAMLIGGLSLASTVITTLSTIGIAFGVLTPAITGVGAAATGASIGIGAMLGPILIVTGVIAGLIAIGWLLYNNWDTIKTGFSDGFNAFIGWIVNLFTVTIPDGANAAKDGIVSGFNNAVDFIGSIPGRIFGFLGHLGSDAFNWGKDMLDGFINGIKSMIGNIGNAAKGIADKIRSFLHFSVPDEGPLTDYETWMPDFMGGLAQGINKNQFRVTDAVKKLSGSIKTNIGSLNSDVSISSNANQSRQNGIYLSKEELLALAKKPLNINGREFAYATVDDFETVLAGRLG